MTKLLDRTINGTPLREWPGRAAEIIAPRRTLRYRTGQSARSMATEAVETRDWQLLGELITDRNISGRDLRAIAAGDPDVTYMIAAGLLTRTVAWSDAALSDASWGPEWRWYLARDVSRVGRALTWLEES